MSKLTTDPSSLKPRSYADRATKNKMAVTSSKQWIHFFLSLLWPPTSTILQSKKWMHYLNDTLNCVSQAFSMHVWMCGRERGWCIGSISYSIFRSGGEATCTFPVPTPKKIHFLYSLPQLNLISPWQYQHLQILIPTRGLATVKLTLMTPWCLCK